MRTATCVKTRSGYRWSFPVTDDDLPAPDATEQAKADLRVYVDPNKYNPNDLGNANMFTDFHRDTVRGLEGTSRWVVWDENSNRFRIRDTDQGLYNDFCAPAVENRLKRAAELERAAARASAGTDDATAINQRANKLETRATATGQLTAMKRYLEIAHTQNAVNRTYFDNDPRLLGVAAGQVLDFRVLVDGDSAAGAIRPASRNDAVLYHAPTQFDPAARSDWVDDYLSKFLPDVEYRRDVFRLLGYCLQRGNPKRLMLFVKGETGSGKSTLLRLFRETIGELGSTVNMSIFRGRAEGPTPEILDAAYQFVTFSSELSGRVKMHGDHVKMITGAGDEIAGRYMYKDFIHKVQPWFTPLIATNAMPSVVDADEALKRRILVLPFDHRLPDADQTDRDFSATDKQHFLRLLVEGRVDVLRGNLRLDRLHPAILTATAEAHADLSFFQSWRSTAVRPVSGAPRHGWAVAIDDAWTHFDREQKDAQLGHDSRIDRTQFNKQIRDAFGKPQSRKRKRVQKLPHSEENSVSKSILLGLEWALPVVAKAFGR